MKLLVTKSEGYSERKGTDCVVGDLDVILRLKEGLTDLEDLVRTVPLVIQCYTPGRQLYVYQPQLELRRLHVNYALGNSSMPAYPSGVCLQFSLSSSGSWTGANN